MPYCTPAQLIDSTVRAVELSQLLDVELLLLIATVSNGDRSSWDAEQIAEADAALASINAELVRADGEVDARLALRGYPLPQDSVQFPILAAWARSIARYHLNALRGGDGADETIGRIERDYRKAIEALQLVAEGKLTLGAGDPLAVPATSNDEGPIRVTSQPRMFDRSTLGRL